MRKLMRGLTLVILTLLTGCESVQVMDARPEPVCASVETKEWFCEKRPLPSHVSDYLNRIVKQQDKLGGCAIHRVCE